MYKLETQDKIILTISALIVVTTIIITVNSLMLLNSLDLKAIILK